MCEVCVLEQLKAFVGDHMRRRHLEALQCGDYSQTKVVGKNVSALDVFFGRMFPEHEFVQVTDAEAFCEDDGLQGLFKVRCVHIDLLFAAQSGGPCRTVADVVVRCAVVCSNRKGPGRILRLGDRLKLDVNPGECVTVCLVDHGLIEALCCQRWRRFSWIALQCAPAF